jgi:hypothetical protein
MPFSSPGDMAVVLHSQLDGSVPGCPTVDDVRHVLEVLFTASLFTDEGRYTVAHVIFLDPSLVTRDSAVYEPSDKHEYFALESPLPLTVRSLVALCSATDPRTSSLVVYPDRSGALVCHGLLDQGHAYHEYLNFEREELIVRPGHFHAAALAPGHVATYVRDSLVSELRASEILPRTHDVIWSPGPVSEFLQRPIVQFLADARARSDASVQAAWNELTIAPEGGVLLVNYVASGWKAVLCRLLLRIKGQRHGGAIVLAPSHPLPGVRLKYTLAYDRIPRAQRSRAVALAKELHAMRTLWPAVRNTGGPIRREDVIAFVSSRNRGDEGRSEVTGAIWFVSLLTRVDGCVVMTPDLGVSGFGGVIETADAVPDLWLAGDVAASEGSLSSADSAAYGTRHRSMISLCSRTPGAVGFVVSQDGGVRAIMKVGERVVMWDRVSLLISDSLSVANTS